MSMSKKDFIALADAIKRTNTEPFFAFDREGGVVRVPMIQPDAVQRLADFCQSQNPAFKRDRWLAYIAGECGSNGGAR